PVPHLRNRTDFQQNPPRSRIAFAAAKRNAALFEPSFFRIMSRRVSTASLQYPTQRSVTDIEPFCCSRERPDATFTGRVTWWIAGLRTERSRFEPGVSGNPCAALPSRRYRSG